MDQLSIVTCCEAKQNGNYDTCHNLLLGEGNWNNLMTANLVFIFNLIMAAVILCCRKIKKTESEIWLRTQSKAPRLQGY